MVASPKRLHKPRMVTWAGAAAPALDLVSAAGVSTGGSAAASSERLQVFGHVHLLRQRSHLHREVDELLEIRLVLGGEIAGHVVADHRHRIDDVLGSEGVLEEMLARL